MYKRQGVSDPYEPPLDPEISLDTENETPEESAQKIIDHLEERSLIPAAQRAGVAGSSGSPSS